MLNYTTPRVMEAEQTKTRSELVYKKTAVRHSAAIGCMRVQDIPEEPGEDEIHEWQRCSAVGPPGCGVDAEGSSTSVEDLSGGKFELDAVSVASESFENDHSVNFEPEDDTEIETV
ncbi:SH3 domain-binding protein 5 [Fukomys damarensis]|uniref:SH3 domain-binding protein 5 n=1 Tax=Fukomys damarensis TaxID=885580 RepID=A0A091DZ67_FUKDA|nr:SH3 domain-binding protein 5 [Fukomys damarensis]